MSDERTRLLLVEDSLADALTVTRRIQHELGSLEAIEVDRVGTLEAAIDRLGKRDVDVVVLDLNLPDSAGTDTVRRLRQADADIPIVVLTGAGDDEVPVRALQAGAQDYLCKSDFETGPVVHRSLRYAIERVRIQNETQRLESELEEAERMESLGVLGAGAAFGFNDLLGQILDHTDEALARLTPGRGLDAARNHLAEARGAALRGAELAEHLRDYARSGRRAMQPLDLSQLLRSDLLHLESIAGQEVLIDVEIGDEVPEVMGCALELRQLLINLVINAVEAIRPERGRIHIATGERIAGIEQLRGCRGAGALEPGRYALLSVSDSGPGIDARTLAHIFDPFFTTRFAGRGLGLAAALGIVRRHRGCIRAENAPGGGARFEVLLPALAG